VERALLVQELRLHLKKLPTPARWCCRAPVKNAGIVDIGQGYAIAFKIESHNHPSSSKHFRARRLGVGGILRGYFTMGARRSRFSIRCDSVRPDSLEAGARNRQILAGVVSGIAHYGNCFASRRRG